MQQETFRRNFDYKNVWDYPFCLQAGELAVYNILCYNKSKQTENPVIPEMRKYSPCRALKVGNTG